MINRNRLHVHTPSYLPKFSDPDILKAVLRSDIWRQIFMGDRKVFWTGLKALAFLKLEMFAAPLKMVLRYKHGKRTTGIFITLMSVVMMIGFNTPHAAGYMVTIFPLVIPALPFVLSAEQFYHLSFIDIRSTYLLVFWLLYSVLSGLHLLVIFTRSKRIHIQPAKRGISILHTVLFRHLKMPEYIVQLLFEPGLVGVTGYILCTAQVDFTFGLFLMLAAASLFLQELYEAIMTFTSEP